MDKVLSLSVDVHADGAYTTYLISPHDQDISDLCTGLMLLKYDLIDTVVFALDPHFSFHKLNRKQAAKMAENQMGYGRWEEMALRLYVKEVMLDTWLRHYLVYQRDGCGDVDHLDFQFDALPNTASRNQLVITLTVPRARIAYHPEK